MMERLTYRDENGKAWANINRIALEQLAAYEDSGLSPEEVQELAKAKADGRLKILPAKPGDIIYRPAALQVCWVITKVERYEDGIVFIEDSDNIFSPDDIGKTVFLTKEEAQKALEKEWPGWVR